jgi:hypothetical protein
MNPYTKLIEVDENANEFGTLFKSEVKLKTPPVFLLSCFQPVMGGFRNCTRPSPGIWVVLRVDNHGCHKIK